MSLMADTRIRVSFDVPDRVRRALNIAAARLNLSAGEVVEFLFERYMQDDLTIADKAITEGLPPPKTKPGPRAR